MTATTSPGREEQATTSKQLAQILCRKSIPATLAFPGVPTFPGRGQSAQCPPGSLLLSVCARASRARIKTRRETGLGISHRCRALSHPPLKSSSSWIPSHTPVLDSAVPPCLYPPACLCRVLPTVEGTSNPTTPHTTRSLPFWWWSNLTPSITTCLPTFGLPRLWPSSPFSSSSLSHTYQQVDDGPPRPPLVSLSCEVILLVRPRCLRASSLGFSSPNNDVSTMMGNSKFDLIDVYACRFLSAPAVSETIWSHFWLLQGRDVKTLGNLLGGLGGCFDLFFPRPWALGSRLGTTQQSRFRLPQKAQAHPQRRAAPCICHATANSSARGYYMGANSTSVSQPTSTIFKMQCTFSSVFLCVLFPCPPSFTSPVLSFRHRPPLVPRHAG